MIERLLNNPQSQGRSKSINARVEIQSLNWMQAGYSLIELLVVLTILAMIAGLVAPQVLGYLGQARSQTAHVQIKNIATALELYYMHNGEYPSELSALMTAPQGVANWRGPYLKKADVLLDPWGRPYRYHAPGHHGEFDIFTLGRDDKEGGTGEDRDVTNW